MSVVAPHTQHALFPVLRPVEVHRVPYQGSDYFLLRDGMEIATQQLLVPLHFGGVLALADGSRSISALVEEARLLYNAPVDEEEVQGLFAALDGIGMLEGKVYLALRAETTAAWRAQAYRPPALAGLGYSDEREALWRKFQALLDASDTPEIPEVALDWGKGVTLLSPHIDYPRGGAVYANVWKAMGAAVRTADVAIILATDHKGGSPFTFSAIDYATPYGVLPTDPILRNALIDTVGEEAAYASELNHRSEHSIELVVNWLHHMRQGEPLPIVPILTGSLHRHIGNGSHPAEDALLNGVINVIRGEMQRRRVLVVASGDLAHVGPAFGGALLDDSGKEELQMEDARLLDAMRQGSAEAFFAEIHRVRDRNNVCGVAPIYLTMRVAADVRGDPVGYAVTPADAANTSVVTIAGVAFI